ncbi:DUF6263 family protein [Plebeiibacterium marinum]|uniref:DUF6263 family protein n=1 Tax=Plebeiibacterium marinum TaxID=2992111 RepID=A0AAE3MGG4_9BACT|nr:DUF6263 family protein [Plebeiobacterium marinum]MCW3807075.1 DUF6263 family protein [Plebeiobacterium marinum]
MRKIKVLALMLVLVASVSAQKVKLTLNLNKGQEYNQNMDSKITISQQVSGMTMDIGMDIKGVMAFVVDEVSNEGYDMSVRYKSLTMKMDLPTGVMEYSSEKGDLNDIFSGILGSMVNKTFYITMLKSGRIKEVRNVDVLFGSMFENFPNVPEAQLKQIKKQLKDAYGAKALKGNMEMVTSVFPEKPVAVGDTWNVDTDMESGFAAKMNSVYKYMGQDEGCYLIEGNSKINTVDKDVYVENNGMKMKYNMKGSLVSKIKVDKKTGWIVEAKIDQEMKGTTEIQSNAQMPNGMSIPMEMKNKMTVTGE